MKRFTTKLSAVFLSACMVLPVLSNGATVSYNNTAIAAETADSAIKFDNEDRFFVYVGTYGGNIPQFRYIYPKSDGSYTADKVLWEDAPTDLSYGDVYVAEGDVSLTQVYPVPEDFANAHVYFYTLDDGSGLNKAGNCADLMETKDLTVTNKTYDGSSHWTVSYVDTDGVSYSYGLSTFGSNLFVNPLDCERHDVYTFAMYNDYNAVPLCKSNSTASELYFNTLEEYLPVNIGLNAGIEIAGYNDDKFYEIGDSPIEFAIDDEQIAKIVSVQGLIVNVMGVSTGETMLNAKTPDGRTASIKVVVSEVPSTSTTAVWNHDTTTTTTSGSYGIGVSQLPDKTVYHIGEELDLTGLRLNGSYTEGDLVACIMDEDYRNVPITVDASEFDNTKAGTYPIYVMYGDAKDSFTVDVIDDLPAGATRVTLFDKDTGELIPNELLETNPFKFHADIVYKQNLFSTVGATTGIADYAVTTNESILEECYLCPELSSLAMAYKKADTFNITTEEQPEITYYDNGSMDLVFKLKFTPTGDVNDDGEFGVSDVVLLQKWLLAVPDTHLANWKAADFCNDNKLNVFDLCLMKRALLEQNDNHSSIVLRCEGERIGASAEKGWYSTEYGHLIEYAQLKENPDIVSLIEKLLSKTDELEATQMVDWNFGIDDYGEDYLYLPYSTYRNGHDVLGRILLCKFGGECGWLDDADVQSLVTLLIENGYYADKSSFEFYLENQ